MTFPNPFSAVQESYRRRAAQHQKKKDDKAKVKEWLEFTAQHRHEQWVDEELEPYLLTGTLHLVDTDASDEDAKERQRGLESPPESPRLSDSAQPQLKAIKSVEYGRQYDTLENSDTDISFSRAKSQHHRFSKFPQLSMLWKSIASVLYHDYV
ncbi:hypothetical protein TWF106_005947 [Orbilia oligospora]|uniref:Uncharacterized protein n=1 Tax=Orbilia oligospora TaxID=2813651 RepID=A0A6G1LSY4_ORBOL|nr:hypothetical protein TWF788_006833 [Orbilia oligospora]KAF3221658.1 hypothetical protein TWF106_005947 [Orbilia oligospora]KAF3225568.1 hypothetical protein TWF191_005268 [Orbilia oligospora]KAF3233685.1 hypothetical protein TWF192_002034 [Orbilia oligospora]